MFLKATSEFLLKKNLCVTEKLFKEEIFYWIGQIKCTDVILKPLIREFPCEFEYSLPAVIHINILMFYHQDI